MLLSLIHKPKQINTITMNLSTLLTLSFAILFTLSMVNGDSTPPDPVLDWAGNPVEVGIPYDLWIVGNGTGPIGMGGNTDQSESQRYVIDYPYNNKTHPFPVLFYAAKYPEIVVRVASDYSIVFDTHVKKRPLNVWTFDLGVGSYVNNFVITGGQYGSPGCENFNIWFQFIAVNGTTQNPYLYKLVVNPQVCNQYNCPTDVIKVRRHGSNCLYLNQYNHIDRPAIEISIVKHQNSEIRQVPEMNLLDD